MPARIFNAAGHDGLVWEGSHDTAFLSVLTWHRLWEFFVACGYRVQSVRSIFDHVWVLEGSSLGFGASLEKPTPETVSCPAL